MLRVESTLKGYAIQATDGRIGSVSDLLFDDATWKIRWLVVDTGNWLSGRKVLLHPSAIGAPEDALRELSVKLTKAQIEGSPDIAQDQPVSRQMERGLYGYYGWDPLWGGRSLAGGGMGYALIAPGFFGAAEPREPDRVDGGRDDQDPHLRSAASVSGYKVHATDGTIGHVESFLVDDQAWDIRYLIIDTRNWWPGRHVLLAPFAVSEIDWSSGQIRLNATREKVRTGADWQPPDWQPDAAFPHEDERRLHAHYGWPGYGW
jgi:hypothetical protein